VSFRHVSLLAIALSLVLSIQCSDSTAPVVGPCNQSVLITVAGSVAPTISWIPNCRVEQLAIEESVAPSAGGGFPIVWLIEARTVGQGAAAPVRYGEVPESMREWIIAAPLRSGHQYVVRLTNTTGGSLGEAGFTY
jgi:hypothetical protein